MPGEVAREDRRRAGVVDVVSVALADGVVGGVEVFAGVFDRDDGDIFGQQRVEAAVEIVVRESRFRRDADDLAERVDAGVGAAGGGDAERLLREPLPGGFERALDGWLVGLKLPAGVCGAVVGYGQFEPADRHGLTGFDTRLRIQGFAKSFNCFHHRAHLCILSR